MCISEHEISAEYRCEWPTKRSAVSRGKGINVLLITYYINTKSEGNTTHTWYLILFNKLLTMKINKKFVLFSYLSIQHHVNQF